MRIAHFLQGRCNPESANGIDKTVYYLSRAQAAAGNEVAVFSFTDKPLLPLSQVTVRAYPPGKLSFLPPQGLLNDLEAWRPDVVHLHSAYVPANLRVASRVRARGTPYVVTPNGGLSPFVFSRRTMVKAAYKQLCELPLLNRAAFVHAVADAHDIMHYGVHTPIVTAPNAVDLTLIPENPQRELLASRIPQARGKFIFLFLGRLDPFHKGLDILLQGLSFAQLKEVLLVVVGPNWQDGRITLEKLACQLNIASQVVFTGPAYGSEKFALLAGADVFVHPSRWEGLPFSVLEAAALAKPCLVTPSADPCGQLTQYQGGITIQPDARSVADGLRQFARLQATRLALMGTNARRMVATEFTWEKTARILERGYAAYATGTLRK